MYRDDDEAARALAEGLRRENAALEEEKAELSNEAAELADDNAALRRENDRLKAALAKAEPKPRAPSRRERREQSRRTRRENAGGPAHPSSWRGGPLAVRIASIAGSAALGAYVTHALYPMFHPARAMMPVIMSGLLSPIWGLALVSQALLGWMPDEDRREALSPGKRAGLLAAGLAAIAITAVFCAFAGEGGADP